MSEFRNDLAGLTATFGAIWLYGSSTEDSHTCFKDWIGGKVASTSPVLKRILLRSLGWAALLGCITITLSSAADVYRFIIKIEPMSRADVFNLVMDCFNSFMYPIVGAAFAGRLLRKRESYVQDDEHQLVLEEHQGFTLMIAEEPGHQLAIERIKNGEVRFQVTKVA
ncbi:hypothetical protein ACS8MQ_08735 [Pseudomonas sp. MAHUQ-62]|uniref:hypothetical protein n=1 Tax=Pseudomonas sp. GCM10023245 TaxID=3252652 RepID=UPI003620FF6B